MTARASARRVSAAVEHEGSASVTPQQSAAAPIVTYQGRRYQLWQGRLLLNWRNRPTLFHPRGCTLCCTLRVTGDDGVLRHPANCPGCGTRYRGPRPDLCRFCGYTAHFHDDDGRPVHKACLEHAILADPADSSRSASTTLDTMRPAHDAASPPPAFDRAQVDQAQEATR